MFSGTQTWVGIRRRASMWLIGAWAVFNVSQVFAVCCMSSADPVHAPAEMASPQQPAHAGDDCCDTGAPERPCTMAVASAPPVAAPTMAEAVRAPNHELTALPIPVPPMVAAFVIVQAPTRIPIPPAPPHPIFLRLQRFLN